MNPPTNSITKYEDSLMYCPIEGDDEQEILGLPPTTTDDRIGSKSKVRVNETTKNLDKLKKVGEKVVESMDKFYGSKKGKIIIGTSIGVGLTVAAVPLAFVAVGFGAGGVVAGSIAAGIQATIGNVAAGSAFAICQSLGATGALTGLSGFASTGVLGIPYFFRRNKKKKNNEQNNVDESDGKDKLDDDNNKDVEDGTPP